MERNGVRRLLLLSGAGPPTERARRQLRRLQWLTTVVPAVAAVLYETVRHSLLEQVLPTSYGNIIVGLVVLVLVYGFSKLVFGEVEQLQAESNARSRDVAALTAIVTEREREILEYVAVRLSNKEIALQLGLSEHTVKNHLKSILRKLHQRSREDAVAYGIARGFIQPSDG